VTEDGSFTERYVYDDGSVRISAEFGYADGTARGTTNANGEYGENFASDFAANEVQKVWYRGSITGSSLFAVEESGDVVAHVIYDPWGNPLTETYTDANWSGIDNLNNYTGYAWDEVLDLYYAQNRFYDPQNHRFTQEDPIKSDNNWYIYVDNNPVTRVDPWGLEAEVYLGGRLINTRTVGGVNYASVRDLITRYGGTLSQQVVQEGNSTYYPGVMRDYEVRFYVKEGHVYTRRLEFRRGGAKYRIASGNILPISGTHYISVEYFQKFACDVLGHTLPLQIIETQDDKIAKFLEIALGEVGYTEEGEDNLTKYGYQNSWCAMFARWCATQAGVPEMIPGTSVLSTRIATDYDEVGRLGDPQKYSPKAGDLILYRNSPGSTSGHTAIVLADEIYSDGTGGVLHTIDGNSYTGSAPDYVTKFDSVITKKIYYTIDAFGNRSYETRKIVIGFGVNGGTSIGTPPN